MHASFSLDNRLIAVTAGDGCTKIFDLQTETSESLSELHSDVVFSPTRNNLLICSPHEGSMYVRSREDETGLYLFDTNSHTYINEGRPLHLRVYQDYMRISPDGRTIACIGRYDITFIQLDLAKLERGEDLERLTLSMRTYAFNVAFLANNISVLHQTRADTLRTWLLTSWKPRYHLLFPRKLTDRIRAMMEVNEYLFKMARDGNPCKVKPLPNELMYLLFERMDTLSLAGPNKMLLDEEKEVME